MTALFELIVASPWEALAVILSIAYVVLAAREHILCWPCALASTAIFSWLFWDVSLPMEAALNVYYLVMAIYGWWLWRRGGVRTPASIHRWSASQHALAIAAVLGLTLVSGTLLSLYRPSAALPFVDSFTTWAAVITTWMVARKIIENWIYWIVIDLVSIYLYFDRGMILTCGLFAIYVVICFFGWQTWRKHEREIHERELDAPATA